jgi:anti-sigma-K factor RskA
MNLHEQFADDLSLYALGVLQPEERQSIEKHLEGCSVCRQELQKMQGDVALLAFSAAGPRPPARSRDRLMAAIAREPRATQLRPSRMAWWNVLGWAAVVSAIVIALFVGKQNSDLRRRVGELETNSARQDQQVREAKQLMAALTSRDAVHYILVAAKTPPQPQGKAIYVRSSGTLVFLASNLPVIPPQKIYELWLIPTSGAAPIPAGLFKPDAHGAAAVIRPPLPVGLEAKAFAITIEPEAGSSAPTSEPIMVGTGT